MTIDRISNMLTTLKNAVKAEKETVEFVHSKYAEKILKTIKQKGFIKEVKTYKPEGVSFKMLRVDFDYENGSPIIEDIKIVSKPGRRIYKSADQLKTIAAGYGVQVVSTSRGVMPSEEARKKKLGGEVICEVK